MATLAANTLRETPNPDWAHVAENIPILKFPDGTTRENATYDGVMIKQADVNLLAFPLEFITDREQIQKDLDYYSPKMSPNGPAMGFAILVALNAKLGNKEKASELFPGSYAPNKVPPFGVLAETAGGTNPYFATGAGGMLQAVLGGFGGLKITDQGITQSGGILPNNWTQLKITGVGKEGNTFEVKN